MNLKYILSILVFIIIIPLYSTNIKYENSAVVFMYHRFGESSYPSTNITIKQFKYQMNYLKENNYIVWPLSKIINYILDKKELPKKIVALTIDDAYISTFTKAYPILKAYDYPFTVFINTNSVNKKSKYYMSWQNMRQMKKNKAEFANHSLSHDYLILKDNETKDIWHKRVVNEINFAQKDLHKELGINTNELPRLFSYPFGEYDKNLLKSLKELGYFGVTQTSGPINSTSDLMLIKRYSMAELFANSKGFITKLNSLVMPIKSVNPVGAILKDKNPPKLRIRLKEELNNLRCYISSGKLIKIKWISEKDLEIVANTKLKSPRERYTCTALADNGNWYWYSHLWIIKKR